MEKLTCLFCRKKFPVNIFETMCPICREPLLVSYPPRQRKFLTERASSLEKFADFLPLGRVNPDLSLGEGNTPLLRLSRLGEKIGFSALYAKNECLNPTASFKDRGTAIVVQKAFSLGIRKIGTVSTGNMASSTAAYGAKAGLETYIFLKEGSSREKALSTGVHGSVMFEVKGDYGRLFEESLNLGKKLGIWFANSVDPFRIEGYKITGYEIYSQLNNMAPRYIIVPVSSGGHLIGLMRAFLDLKEEGCLDKLPVFVGVQARGCAPLARAFFLKKEEVRRVSRPETVAHAISNPAPPAGNLALKLIRENGGMLLDVSDREILKAQKDLAVAEGVFCDPAAATTLAGLRKLSGSRKIKSRDKIVLIITGSGLKSMEVLEHQEVRLHRVSLSRLEYMLSGIGDGPRSRFC